MPRQPAEILEIPSRGLEGSFVVAYIRLPTSSSPACSVSVRLLWPFVVGTVAPPLVFGGHGMVISRFYLLRCIARLKQGVALLHLTALAVSAFIESLGHPVKCSVSFRTGAKWGSMECRMYRFHKD